MEGEINKVFKKVLLSFLKENMRSCESMLRSVEQARNYDDLKDSFESYGEEIAEQLGVELEPECYYCGKKESIIEELEYKLMMHSFTPKTLDDEYKLEAFVRNKDNFSVSDFESLLD